MTGLKETTPNPTAELEVATLTETLVLQSWLTMVEVKKYVPTEDVLEPAELLNTYAFEFTTLTVSLTIFRTVPSEHAMIQETELNASGVPVFVVPVYLNATAGAIVGKPAGEFFALMYKCCGSNVTAVAFFVTPTKVPGRFVLGYCTKGVPAAKLKIIMRSNHRTFT